MEFIIKLFKIWMNESNIIFQFNTVFIKHLKLRYLKLDSNKIIDEELKFQTQKCKRLTFVYTVSGIHYNTIKFEIPF